MTDVSIRDVTVTFGSVSPLQNFSLDIRHGEIFFLMGPSGCGKTTLLRTVAGLQAPSTGKIFFKDADVTSLPIGERGVGMVFQSYCLWPHMTVEENIAFGLHIQKLDSHEVKKRLDEIVSITGLADHLKKYPHQLSGGQQQRVSLARALVLRPEVLLLDEPFSNLDATLRSSIREEVRRLRESFDLTMLFVTHDFEEAMNIGSRVIFLDKGKIQVAGTPEEVYKNPLTKTAAALSGLVLKVPSELSSRELYCRPEALFITSGGLPNGKVQSVSYESSSARVEIRMKSGDRIELFMARGQAIPSVGSEVCIQVRTEELFHLEG